MRSGGREETTGSTSGGMETLEEKKAQVRASRETALLLISLVPEVAAAVGNAGARGAGHWGPFAEGRSKAASSKGLARDHLGP